MKNKQILLIVLILCMLTSCSNKKDRSIEIISANAAGQTSCLSLTTGLSDMTMEESRIDKSAKSDETVSFLEKTLHGQYYKTKDILGCSLDYYQSNEEDAVVEFAVDRKTRQVCFYWDGNSKAHYPLEAEGIQSKEECLNKAIQVLKAETGMNDFYTLSSDSELIGTNGVTGYSFKFVFSKGNIIFSEIYMDYYIDGELMCFTNYQQFNMIRYNATKMISEDKAIILADKKVEELLINQEKDIEIERLEQILYYLSEEGNGWLGVYYNCKEKESLYSDRLVVLIPTEMCIEK